jgi:protein required for attachment to host cells
MGDAVRIPHDAWVLVGDGRKALVFQNEGSPDKPRLVVQEVFEAPANPSAGAQGSERPGRVISSAEGGTRRSAVEATDWHEIAEARFARDVASALAEAARAGRFDRLAVVAPPKTLAELRDAFDDPVRKKIIGELDKTLTNHPVPEIERLLAG